MLKKILALCLISVLWLAASDLRITRLKYGGGGDWYSNAGSLDNLRSFIRKETGLQVDLQKDVVEAGSQELFSRHFLYMNGHGNVAFTDEESARMRFFLENGGFLHADDNYGMDQSFRREMKKIFPDKEWVELPPDHGIFNIHFNFPEGLPKIHEHDGKPPQALALFHEDRICVLYTYESDLGDGWEDENVHNDPADIREAALQMGTNIFLWHLRVPADER